MRCPDVPWQRTVGQYWVPLPRAGLTVEAAVTNGTTTVPVGFAPGTTLLLQTNLACRVYFVEVGQAFDAATCARVSLHATQGVVGVQLSAPIGEIRVIHTTGPGLVWWWPQP